MLGEHAMADNVPKWLEVMRRISGTKEYSGAANNPKIMGWVDTIARTYPEMKSYCDLYTGDDIAWCGLTVAYCMTEAGIRPVFGPTDTDKWMWAQAWAGDSKNFKPTGRVTPGTIVVMTRSGGGHVTLFEEWDGDMLRCRGGNQSDQVNVASYDPETVIQYVWPVAAGDQPQVPVEDRPDLEEGDRGPDVVDMQSMIPFFTGEVDGDFGPTTEDNVLAYQWTRGLDVDGECGQQTWGALYDDAPAVITPPVPPPNPLTPQQQTRVKEIANNSRIAAYSWQDRGQAPTGYVQGMALAFAQTYLKLKAQHPAAMEMAKAVTTSDKDALKVYGADFRSLGMSNSKDGADTLRHLYALMLGSGMRESSGQYCCGRDQSADNVDADTCEAGTFQTSYNANGASDPEFNLLMAEYGTGQSPGYREAFAEDVSCDDDDWECFGSGPGLLFQRLCKMMPAFAVETHALTLRNLCNHYGPINRHEVELKKDADEMFKAVQDYIDSQEVISV